MSYRSINLDTGAPEGNNVNEMANDLLTQVSIAGTVFGSVERRILRTHVLPDRRSKMKRLYLPAIVASAAALLLVVSASSAYAVQVFLLNGGKIEKSINVTVTGELLLEDMNAPGTPDI